MSTSFNEKKEKMNIWMKVVFMYHSILTLKKILASLRGG
jgi:hypothetical protein